MTGNPCSAALPWRRIKAWNSWWLHVSCNIQQKYFRHYLFQYLKNHRGCQSWVIFSGSILKKKEKKIDKADRRKGRCWQIPAFSYCSVLSRKTKAERRCWEKRVASAWVVPRRQQMAWKPNIGLPRHTCDPPPQATTHNQASTARKDVSVQSKVCEVRSRDTTPVPWQVDPHRCRLFVILKW